MEKYLDRIGEQVALYMHRSGNTREQVATRLGMSHDSLSNKLNGRTEFKASELAALHEITGASLDELFAD